MENVVIIGDLHFGVRNGSIIFLNMVKKYFDEEFFPFLIKNNIKYVIQLGDILDKRKSIDFVISNYLTNTFFKFFQDHDIQFYSTIGNHDLYYRQSIEIDGPSQFSSYSNVHIIKKLTDIVIDGKHFILCPWICDENKEKIFTELNNLQNTQEFILCGHFELAGFPIQKGFISDKEGLPENILDKFYKVLSGHYHSPSSKRNVSYIGTPYQLTWADYGDKKKFIVYNTESNEFEEIYTKNNIYHKLIYSDNMTYNPNDYTDSFVKIILNHDYDEAQLSLFLTEFENSTNLYGLQVVNQIDSSDEIEEISASDIDNPIDIMTDVINNRIENEVIKKMAIQLSYEIYKEAQSMQI